MIGRVRSMNSTKSPPHHGRLVLRFLFTECIFCGVSRYVYAIAKLFCTFRPRYLLVRNRIVSDKLELLRPAIKHHCDWRAQVTVPPDLVIISATVETTDSEVLKAQSNNGEITQQIKKFLKEQRVTMIRSKPRY